MSTQEQSSEDSHGEDRAATLDLPPEELTALARAFFDLTLDYIGSASALPVFPDTSAELLNEIFRRPLPAEGCGLESLERDCREVIRHSRQNGHPRMFGYIASPSSPAGALASLLAAALNSNVTSWRSAPAATEVERTTLRWLAELIGFAGGGVNETCGGLLTSGGSMANLDALFVAHRAKSRAAAQGFTQDTAGNTPPDASRYSKTATLHAPASSARAVGVPRAARWLT